MVDVVVVVIVVVFVVAVATWAGTVFAKITASTCETYGATGET
jgi:hypothetical protein